MGYWSPGTVKVQPQAKIIVYIGRDKSLGRKGARWDQLPKSPTDS